METTLNPLFEDRILKLPEEKKNHQINVVSISTTLEEKRKQIRITVSNIAGKVASDITLKNDMMRKSAIVELQLNDVSYQGLLTDVILLEGQVKAEQIELDYLHNLFRAFITVAQIKGVK